MIDRHALHCAAKAAQIALPPDHPATVRLRGAAALPDSIVAEFDTLCAIYGLPADPRSRFWTAFVSLQSIVRPEHVA